MTSFLTGLSYVFDGFGLIFKPGLKRYILVPVLINMIFFTAIFFILRHFVGEFNAWMGLYLPEWMQWLATMLWLLFFLSFTFLVVFMFTTAANLFAAPFNSLLAEKVERYLSGHVPEDKKLFDHVRDVPRIVKRQLHIIIYYLPRVFFIGVLFLIPIVQTVASVIWFLFHAWTMTLTYLDYPSDNHRVSVPHVRSWLRDNRFMTLGFGVTVLLLSTIPGINFLVMPAAVAGATKCWVEQHR